jgi:hypothetical protein
MRYCPLSVVIPHTGPVAFAICPSLSLPSPSGKRPLTELCHCGGRCQTSAPPRIVMPTSAGTAGLRGSPAPCPRARWFRPRHRTDSRTGRRRPLARRYSAATCYWLYWRTCYWRCRVGRRCPPRGITIRKRLRPAALPRLALTRSLRRSAGDSPSSQSPRAVCRGSRRNRTAPLRTSGRHRR